MSFAMDSCVMNIYYLIKHLSKQLTNKFQPEYILETVLWNTFSWKKKIIF